MVQEPALEYVTEPGDCDVELDGEPPVKFQLYAVMVLLFELKVAVGEKL